MFGGPGLREGEFGVGIDSAQPGDIAEVVGVAVAVLDLRCEVEGLGAGNGLIVSVGVEDGEAVAGNCGSGELGFVVGKAVFDFKGLGLAAVADDEAVALFPSEVEAVVICL